MKKLNGLTNPVTGLDGQPITNQVGPNSDGVSILVPETVGHMLANTLARAQSSDSVLAMMIAMRIYKEDSVNLEDAEFVLVQEAINKDQLLTNLGKAALVTTLNRATEE